MTIKQKVVAAPASRLKFISDEQTYKADAYIALSSRFASKTEFEIFYSSLSDDVTKDRFLRVATLYLFLVKKGEWRVDVPRSNPVIDYFTNSFKLVALLSLIESLSEHEHKDFYQWLCGSEQKSAFPIADRAALSKLNALHKAQHGSIRRCKAFFESMPTDQKATLCKAVQLGGKHIESVSEIAAYLYDLRSKFAHEGQFVLGITNGTAISNYRGKRIVSRMSMTKLLEAFEIGLVEHFSRAR